VVYLLAKRVCVTLENETVKDLFLEGMTTWQPGKAQRMVSTQQMQHRYQVVAH